MSEMWERFQCQLSLQVDDQVRGLWAAPQHESLTLGRVPHTGLHIGNSWVTSRLGRLVPFDRGWVLQPYAHRRHPRRHARRPLVGESYAAVCAALPAASPRQFLRDPLAELAAGDAVGSQVEG